MLPQSLSGDLSPYPADFDRVVREVGELRRVEGIGDRTRYDLARRYRFADAQMRAGINALLSERSSPSRCGEFRTRMTKRFGDTQVIR
jgi:hypothetical protein